MGPRDDLEVEGGELVALRGSGGDPLKGCDGGPVIQYNCIQWTEHQPILDDLSSVSVPQNIPTTVIFRP